MQTDREYFAHHLTGNDPGHLAAIRRAPVLSGYDAALDYLAKVRGAIGFARTRLVIATSTGELAYYPIGRGYCFTADDLDAWLESLRVGGAA